MMAGERYETDELADGLAWTPLRWGACFVAIVGLHLAVAWFILHRRPLDEPAPSPPPAAEMMDLAPLPAAPPAPPSEMPPGPRQTESEPPPPPEPDVQKPLPEAPPSEIAVPLPPPSPAPPVVLPEPPKPKPRPVERQVERRQTARRPVNQTPPAPATTAPPQAEAPPAPSAVAPAPGASSAPASNAVPTWQGLLVGRLERFKRYPYEAQYRHQQGVVYLHFTMDRSGRVLTAAIGKSSGFDALDEEALALIHRAEPLPAPPREVTGDPIELTVPVQFFLK
jgi:periplasmic protein TonB